MKNFHGTNKINSFFEGWYLKHQSRHHTLALIPSYHVDSDGIPSAQLQVITNDGSWNIDFPKEAFHAHPKKFEVYLGKNKFTETGISLDISEVNFNLKGSLAYGPLTPLKYNIMGPFSILPFMECNHGILSLSHSVSGMLTLNDKVLEFTQATGYIEKDWGTSFPSFYTWTQCNWNENNFSNCVMLSVADIPFMKRCFTGCICSILFEGTEYRLATYLGVQIKKYSRHEVCIKQGKLYLKINLINENPYKLKAPNLGHMTRIIHESPSCTVRYRFYKCHKLIFDKTISQASFEYCR